MQNKKGQQALEFLMDYGWAILIIFAVIGALVYYGVLFSTMSKLPLDKQSCDSYCELLDYDNCSYYGEFSYNVECIKYHNFNFGNETFNFEERQKFKFVK